MSSELAVLNVEKHFNELALLFDLIKRELDKKEYKKKQQESHYAIGSNVGT
ncbi:hypothetical protein HX017_16270 [Myroides marinus]|uniref:hypothetical protein n=1 Tax=Myroides marinus TaxID=703342 RepID=UPI0025790666|nr:hypothetical protein [Myroides marinus]MDM1352024.1 hypothetical protein [Myroides marinus]MDM1359209.1 hypothetical protein [Myroides marinus]MDM1366492.1 hypothetical protein [Myroides marinus]MDM1380702.1 hypothetical protein [Myroides marinus]MDM1387984.1 hypothetical protein [Myroides marinus]